MLQIIEIILLLVIVLKLAKPELVKLKNKRQSMIVDSCGLIDGRIIDLAKSGFINRKIIVPEFVIHELQLLADGADTKKRERARYGLDVIKDLQAETAKVQVEIDATKIEGRHQTDDKLVMLSKQYKAQLYTTDFNLQKVAEIAGITVLNVNDLAQQLRLAALPGERKQITLLQKGNTAQQAVGYLDDGTMVVVENAAKYIGKKAEVEITRTHQTVAGKMLFANLVGIQRPKPAPQPKPLVANLKNRPLKTAKRPALLRKRVN